MKFDYKREEINIEIEGIKYPIPTKTIKLLDDINVASKAITKAEQNGDVKGIVTALKSGIAAFLSEDVADKLYPDIEKVDTDEITALWWLLNKLSNEATNAVIEKYAPHPIIKTK